MLIDWVTARVPLDQLSPAARQAALELGDRTCRYCPKTGEVRYEAAVWESVRSDSHQIAMKAGSDLWIQGSPARVIGCGDAVFGSGASAALDLLGCVDRMRLFVAGRLGCDLPPADRWIVSRVDVTENLLMDSLPEVRQALSILRGVEGGRYRVSSQQGDTVYWGGKSRLRKGKAYAKGPHLASVMRNPAHQGRAYTPAEVALAGRLLRLELTLGREWFARNDWRRVTAANLRTEWESYFYRMIGSAEVTADCDLQERVINAALATVVGKKSDGSDRYGTEGMGRAAYGCWLAIKNEGWERAREFFSRSTWYRHLLILRAAGLSDADLSTGSVVLLRRSVIDCRPVSSWADLACAV